MPVQERRYSGGAAAAADAERMDSAVGPGWLYPGEDRASLARVGVPAVAAAGGGLAVAAAVAAAAAADCAGSSEPSNAEPIRRLCWLGWNLPFQRTPSVPCAVARHPAAIPGASTARSCAAQASGSPAWSFPPPVSFCPPRLWQPANSALPLRYPAIDLWEEQGAVPWAESDRALEVQEAVAAEEEEDRGPASDLATSSPAAGAADAVCPSSVGGYRRMRAKVRLWNLEESAASRVPCAEACTHECSAAGIRTVGEVSE